MITKGRVEVRLPDSELEKLKYKGLWATAGKVERKPSQDGKEEGTAIASLGPGAKRPHAPTTHPTPYTRAAGPSQTQSDGSIPAHT